MKRIIALFTMLMFLGAGTAMSQAPNLGESDNATHTVSLDIEDWSYIDVQGGAVSFNAHTLNDANGNAPDGEVKYDDHSTSLIYGTNANSPMDVKVQIGEQTPSGVRLSIRTGQDEMGIVRNDYTLGSEGEFSGNFGYGSDIPASPTSLISGVHRGGGETGLRYDVYLDFFQSNEVGDFEESVTYTLTASTGE